MVVAATDQPRTGKRKRKMGTSKNLGSCAGLENVLIAHTEMQLHQGHPEIF
jgi:hypothetical protein